MIEPSGPPQAYLSFQAVAPRKTHFRRARNCEEADCTAYKNGWVTLIDTSTEKGRNQLDLFNEVKKHYKYTVEKLPEGFIKITFPPGQNCFRLATHLVRIERPERFFIRKGDYRAYDKPTEFTPAAWQDIYQHNQEAVKRRLERG